MNAQDKERTRLLGLMLQDGLREIQAQVENAAAEAQKWDQPYKEMFLLPHAGYDSGWLPGIRNWLAKLLSMENFTFSSLEEFNKAHTAAEKLSKALRIFHQVQTIQTKRNDLNELKEKIITAQGRATGRAIDPNHFSQRFMLPHDGRHSEGWLPHIQSQIDSVLAKEIFPFDEAAHVRGNAEKLLAALDSYCRDVSRQEPPTPTPTFTPNRQFKGPRVTGKTASKKANGYSKRQRENRERRAEENRARRTGPKNGKK